MPSDKMICDAGDLADEAPAPERSTLSRAFENLNRRWALGRLESEIADLRDTAQGHLRNGVQPGDPVFARLYERASGRIDQYLKENGNPGRQALIDDMPAYVELRNMTQPGLKKSQIMVLVVILLPVLYSLELGAIHWIGAFFHAALH